MTCEMDNLKIDRRLCSALMQSFAADCAQSTNKLTSYASQILPPWPVSDSYFSWFVHPISGIESRTTLIYPDHPRLADALAMRRSQWFVHLMVCTSYLGQSIPNNGDISRSPTPRQCSCHETQSVIRTPCPISPVIPKQCWSIQSPTPCRCFRHHQALMNKEQVEVLIRVPSENISSHDSTSAPFCRHAWAE